MQFLKAPTLILFKNALILTSLQEQLILLHDVSTVKPL